MMTRRVGQSPPVATNERYMAVPPEAVWEALADPQGYAFWVVGSKRIRDADPGWPAPGTVFHHTIGLGPLTRDDHTESLAADPPRRLELRAKGRPLGTAKVTLELLPHAGGTLVRMTENPDGLFAPLKLNPAVHVLTRYRNAESLMRLEELAARR
jgi:uncharacterized protein YndB with AHSA1/START domain